MVILQSIFHCHFSHPNKHAKQMSLVRLSPYFQGKPSPCTKLACHSSQLQPISLCPAIPVCSPNRHRKIKIFRDKKPYILKTNLNNQAMPRSQTSNHLIISGNPGTLSIWAYVCYIQPWRKKKVKLVHFIDTPNKKEKLKQGKEERVKSN